MVKVNRSGVERCIWCTETKEGVDVVFDDGLKGFWCKACFWRAIRVRTKKQEPRAHAHAGNNGQ